MGDRFRIRIIRRIVHLLFPVRKAQYQELKKFAKNITRKKVLDIGSGNHHIEKFFDNSNTIIKSDINPDYGYEVIDITRMSMKNEFDVIVCINVLEHVFDYNKAISNMYHALKPGGVLFLCVPFSYPLHDEPHDYWRFTEHSLQKLFTQFSDVEIHPARIRAFPYNYSVICKKPERTSKSSKGHK